MTALNTYELRTLLHKVANRHGQMMVLGVFPADQLPSMRSLRTALANAPLCCFIANTDPANRPGTRWVLFIASQTRGIVHLEYFDSYGLPIELLTDLYISCRRLHYVSEIRKRNTITLQSTTSSVCGHYCLLVAHFRAMGKSFDFIMSYLRSFSLITLERDKIVVRALHSVLHRCGDTMCMYSKCLTKENGQTCCSAAK